MAARVAARQALKPPVRSWAGRPRTIRAKRLPPRLDEPPPEAPVHDAAAGRVARADDEVGRAVRERRERAPAGRPGRATSRRPSGRPGAAPPSRATRNPARYARPRPAFAARCRTRTRASAAARRSAMRAGPVGRAVVDDEERGGRERREDRRRDRLQVLGLVVRRQDDPGPRAVGRGHRRPGRRPRRAWRHRPGRRRGSGDPGARAARRARWGLGAGSWRRV